MHPRSAAVLGQNPGPFTLSGTNTYIVGTGRTRILVDTGQGADEYAACLREAMSEHGCVGFQHVVLTHEHYDHVGGISQVAELSPGDCTFWKFPTPPGRPSSYVGEGERQASRTALADAALRAVAVRDLLDGQRIQVEGATLRVVHTPGHTGDHVALVLEEENAVFTGDCVLGTGSAVFEDLGAYMRSLRLLQGLETKALYPGHGPHHTDGRALIEAYVAHRLERERQVVDALSAHAPDSERAKSARELVDVVYPGIPAAVIPGALNNLRLVLEQLRAEGRAACCSAGSLWSLPPDTRPSAL